MFLDEKLYLIAKQVNPDSDTNLVIAAIREMLSTCMESINEQVEGCATDANIKANFRRVDFQWRQVCDKLDKEGFGFIEPNGFKNTIEKLHPGIFFK